MPFRLDNKHAIITGGKSGIGKAIAELFVREGAFAHILDWHVTKEDLGTDRMIFYKCDVSNNLDVKRIIDQIGSIQQIDILVNNAGIAHVGNIENTTEDDIDRLYLVNVKGVYNCAGACIPYMRKAGQGVILNMASIASTVAVADRFAYSMTKGAVLSMTYSLAKDYIHEGIRCNSISPARIHTPFVDGFLADNYPGREKEMFEALSKTQPIGRMGTPEEVACLALYLCSDEAAFITGTDFPIDGGFIKLNG